MPQSDITPPTWSCSSTATPLTSRYPTHGAVSEVCFFLGNKSPEQETLNGSILNVAAVIKNVVASAAESEVGACFHNAQSGAPLRVTLTELGHKQPPTPLRTYNSTAYGIVNETIKQKRSKAMDMRYHWLTDRVRQRQFNVFWRPGLENLGDYHTKHHSAQHHKDMRHLILHEANSLQVLRGCVKQLPLPQPPMRARTDAQTHGRTDAPKRPGSHPTKECARARVSCLNTEPNYYYCPITLVMS
jgi:acyl transferase domain-containing protein